MVKKDLSSKGIISADQLDQWRTWAPGELEAPLQGLTAAQLEALAVAAGNAVSNDAPDAGEDVPDEDDLPPGPQLGYPTAAELESIHQEAWQAGQEAGMAAGLEEGQARGMEQGLAEGLAAMQQRFESAWAPLDALAQQFTQELRVFEAEMSGDLLAFAVRLAERVVAAHLAVDPRAIEPLLHEALAVLPASLAQGRLRVNPEDLAVVREFLQTERPETVWQWVEDSGVARGGCLLETPSLRQDLTLPSRMRALSAALGLESGDDESA